MDKIKAAVRSKWLTFTHIASSRSLTVLQTTSRPATVPSAPPVQPSMVLKWQIITMTEHFLLKFVLFLAWQKAKVQQRSSTFLGRHFDSIVPRYATDEVLVPTGCTCLINSLKNGWHKRPIIMEY